MGETDKKEFPVAIIQEDLLAGIATGGHMINCAGILEL